MSNNNEKKLSRGRDSIDNVKYKAKKKTRLFSYKIDGKVVKNIYYQNGAFSCKILLVNKNVWLKAVVTAQAAKCSRPDVVMTFLGRSRVGSRPTT